MTVVENVLQRKEIFDRLLPGNVLAKYFCRKFFYILQQFLSSYTLECHKIYFTLRLQKRFASRDCLVPRKRLITMWATITIIATVCGYKVRLFYRHTFYPRLEQNTIGGGGGGAPSMI